MEKNIQGEKMYTWIGNVGLANVTDVLRASTNPVCTSVTDQYNAYMEGNNTPCGNNNLLDYGSSEGITYWTINSTALESKASSAIAWDAGARPSNAILAPVRARLDDIPGVRPAVYHLISLCREKVQVKIHML